LEVTTGALSGSFPAAIAAGLIAYLATIISRLDPDHWRAEYSGGSSGMVPGS